MSTSSNIVWKYTREIDLMRYNAVFELAGSTRFETKDGTWYVCEDWAYSCKESWNNYPANNFIPFWPISPGLIAANSELQEIYGNYTDSSSLPIASSYVMALLISTTTDGFVNQVVDPAELPDMTIRFLGKMGSMQGDPIVGVYQAEEQDVACSYDALGIVQERVNSFLGIVNSLDDYDEVQNARFQMDITKFDDSWVGCQNLINSMLQSSTTYEIQITESCVSIPGTPEYDNDPCCSSVAAWSSGKF
jgi:hypothetical protein